jgi:hypothetical protein
MKKIIFNAIILFVANYSFGQFTNVKDTVFATMPVNSELSITDTLFNFGTTAIPIQWNVSSSTIIAPGHSGVSVCSFPGACYNFDTTVHTETVNPSSKLLFILTWSVAATAQPGSTSYVILNTNIGGGKDLVRKIRVSGNPLSVSMEEFSNVQSIKLYPIPSTDILNVEMPDIKSSKIEIINSCGSVVSTTPTYGNLKAEIGLNNLNAGLYIVNIYNAENTIVARRKINKN